MSPVENARLDRFQREHKCNYGGLEAKVITVTLKATGIGDAVIVACCCGHKENITDTDGW